MNRRWKEVFVPKISKRRGRGEQPQRSQSKALKYAKEAKDPKKTCEGNSPTKAELSKLIAKVRA
jgi:hypothetical protein